MPATARVEVDLAPVRWAGIGMLAVAAVRPLVGSPGIPCPLRAMTGVPCPLCGMTRGVTDAVHGDLVHALALNPGSVLLVVAAIALLVAWRRRTVAFPPWLVVAVIAGMWAFQLFKYATGRPL